MKEYPKLERHSSIYLIILVIFFLVFFVIGYNIKINIIEIDYFDRTNLVPNQKMTFIDCFSDIFITNTVVGFLVLYLMSFFTAGTIAILVLSSNSYILGILFNQIIENESISNNIKILSMIHIPSELFAFFLLSFISRKGYNFFKDLFSKNTVNILNYINFRFLTISLLLIFFSALIESYVIINFIINE